MLGRLLACGAVTASLSLHGAIASAQSPQPSPGTLFGASPVTISACQITRRARYRNVVSPYPLPITGGLRIAFVNHGSSPAKDIRFHVDYRGESEVIEDAGTFSPGALVSHSFDNFSDYAYLGPTPNICAVVSVRFADGTVWNAVSHGQMRRPL
jgi:hypothetical protein